MRHRNSMPIPASAARAWSGPIAPVRLAALRQVEEFSPKLARLRRVAYFSAGVLLLLAAACVFLFLRQVDILALYTAGAAVLLIQLVLAGSDYYYEERRTVEAYRKYLDTYSHQVIRDLRQRSDLSEWSRYEIDRYLAVPHLI